MVELGEGGARNHAADFAEGAVMADAGGGVAEAQPDASAAVLDGAGQGAIVDQFAADALDAADAFQGGAPDENAAAGRARGAVARIANPGGRIEQEEEEDERGNQRLFGEGAAVQADHVGHQVVVALLRRAPRGPARCSGGCTISASVSRR